MRSSPPACLFRCATSRFVRVGVRDHRPELEDPEPRVAPAHSHLPEEDGPTRVELDRDRDRRRSTGASTTAPTNESDDVHRTLEEQRRPRPAAPAADRSAAGPRRHACVACGPSASKRRGTMSTWTPRWLRSRIDLERLGVRMLREGDDDAVDVESRDDLRQLRGRRGRRDAQARRPAPEGASSTKPTTFTLYSGCWSSFLATRCPTWPAPTTSVFWT